MNSLNERNYTLFIRYIMLTKKKKNEFKEMVYDNKNGSKHGVVAIQ